MYEKNDLVIKKNMTKVQKKMYLGYKNVTMIL